MAYMNQLFAVAILFGVIQLAFSDCLKEPEALGMENNIILDSQITTSSNFDIAHRGCFGRLNGVKTVGSVGVWCPYGSAATQWLQVDLKDKAMVFSISTQGRSDNIQWVKTYIISYSNDGNNFQDYTENGPTKIFQGNTDGLTTVNQQFTPPIDARYIRINPQTWYNYIAIRIELFGCFHHKDPYRWTLSRGKRAVQSSTEPGFYWPSYATNSDFNNLVAPMYYTQTTLSNKPYLQVDMGESLMIDVVVCSTPSLPKTSKKYYIEITAGDSPTVGDATNVQCLKQARDQLWKYVTCQTMGRYVVFKTNANNVNLTISEVAVYKRAIESIGYRKLATSISVDKDNHGGNSLDMSFTTFFKSQYERDPWLRVNLEDFYFIDEIVLKFRGDCKNHCGKDMEIRVGNDLENNGNSNPICATSIVMFSIEWKSFYCDMIGQYVNIIRYVEKHTLTIADVIINPEKTDNVAAHKQGLSNTESISDPKYLADLSLQQCFVSKRINELKWVWLKLLSTFVISKIFIANNHDHMNELVDFDIKIGMSESYESSSYCLPGLQSMRGMETASFFCEPRVSGQYVFIKQHRTDKTLSICEIGVFEEAEATIVNRKTDQHVWTRTGEDVAFNCDAKGYPTPVVTWVKDDVVIESSSNHLQLTSVSSNDSGTYECWANNTHGLDVKFVDLAVSSNLHVCMDSLEVKYDNEKDVELKGNEWYKFYDESQRRYLQLFEMAPWPGFACQIWLNGEHPKLQDSVVSRSLCVKDESHDCSATADILVRTCGQYYVYNIKYSQNLTASKYCFMNGPNNDGGLDPVIAYPVANHALSQKVHQTETEVQESYKCLMMCQLVPVCKSFNFSKKFKVCELNTATKSEFPGNYGVRENYEYYHIGKGIAMAVKGEL